jgi:hypothetical protein
MNAEVLKGFNLPVEAVRYLLDLYLVIQAWDDFVDETPMARVQKDSAIYASLVGIPVNPFYIQNASILLPLISNCVLKWKAADTAEREGGNLHLAYGWRAGYFEVVLQVILIVHGFEVAMKNAHEVMKLYGESFEDYSQEFQHA